MKKLLLLVFIGLLTIAAKAQPFRISTYNLDKGLPTDFIKCATQDSLGFLWIGTDDGLVRFDGKTSVLFSNQLPSNYVKALYKTSKNKVYVITDLGVTEIISRADTTIFKTLVYGVNSINNVSDTTVNYPKSMFEDSKGNLWIGDYNNILMVNDKTKKKYKFGPGEISDSYLRSFCVTEDGFGRIWTTSFSGHLFYLDNKSDAFVHVNSPAQMYAVSDLIKLDKNIILAGSATGVYQIKTSENPNECSVSLLNNTPQIGSLAKVDENKVFIGTWNLGLHLLRYAAEKTTVENVGIISNITINQFYYSKDKGDLWICTSDGIRLLQPTFFATLTIENKSGLKANIDFIQSIAQGADGSVYISSGPGVSLVSKVDKNITGDFIAIWGQSGFIARIQPVETGLYLSDSHGQLFFYNFKTKKYQPLTDEPIGRFGMFMTIDKEKNIWACQEAFNGLVKITPGNKIIKYQQNEGIGVQPNIIRCAADGSLFVGSITDSAYLFKYDASKNTFTNLSIPLGINNAANFKVNDLAIDDKNVVWLGTSQGLFKYHDKKIEKIDLGEIYTNLPIKALAINKEGLWIANTFGILLYTDNSIFFYDKSSGLPANTITVRNLLIDSEDRLWVGTPKGASFSLKRSSTAKKTECPLVLNVSANGQKLLYFKNNQFTVNNHSFIEIDFASLSFPNDKIKYQYRIADISPNWSKAFTDRKLLLTPLSTGKHNVEIRAIKDGGDYQWSDAVTIVFNVDMPWYSTWWAIFLYIMAFLLILYFSVRFYTWKLERDKIRLEKIIMQRTAEIQKQTEEITEQRNNIELQNQELQQQKEEILVQTEKLEDTNKILEDQKGELELLNKTKDKFFSIIGHDLKNPIGALMNYTEILMNADMDIKEAERAEFYEIINFSAKHTFSLLENLLNWSRTQTGSIRFDPKHTSLTELVNENITLLKANAKSKTINLYTDIKDDLRVFADPNMVKTVIRNLITNAIKFTHENGSIKISGLIDADKIIVSITDSGVGISEENIAKIFKVGEHHTTQGTNNEAGTGLGLVICREFVEKNGGKIWVTSDIGKGTTFSFTIPHSTEIPNDADDLFEV